MAGARQDGGAQELDEVNIDGACAIRARASSSAASSCALGIQGAYVVAIGGALDVAFVSDQCFHDAVLRCGRVAGKGSS